MEQFYVANIFCSSWNNFCSCFHANSKKKNKNNKASFRTSEQSWLAVKKIHCKMTINFCGIFHLLKTFYLLFLAFKSRFAYYGTADCLFCIITQFCLQYSTFGRYISDYAPITDALHCFNYASLISHFNLLLAIF